MFRVILLLGFLAASTGAVCGAILNRPERILIQPKAGVTAARINVLHSQAHGVIMRAFPKLGGLQILEVPAAETAESLLAKYRASGLVDFAEPDYVGQIFSTTPNDPKFVDGTLWALYTNSAPQAWDVLTSASNIVVAVLDTGMRYTHEDLKSNLWTNPLDGSHGWNAINNNNDPSDFTTHGTMVSGVLGATGNNGKGVCGVAWRVQLMPCACFNNFGLGNVSDVITCLEFARTNGAKIINASWGFTNSIALSNEMVNLRNSGVIVVAACGNSATNIDVQPTFPASYALDNIVAVASTSKADSLSSFSNYGATSVALAAPGEQIYSTFPATDSFYLNDATGGTSYSAPYVAGACALLMAQYPSDNYRDIIARLLGATDPLPSLAGKCRTGGRLNLAKILRMIRLAPTVTITNFSLRVAGGVNRLCVVETSTNLSAWFPLATNTCGTNGTFDFSDSQTINFSRRFYRAAGNP